MIKELGVCYEDKYFSKEIKNILTSGFLKSGPIAEREDFIAGSKYVQIHII